MSDMMKKMGKGGMAGLMQQMGGMPGGIPKNSVNNKGLPAADDLQLEELKKQLGNMPGSGSGLPGLGGGNRVYQGLAVYHSGIRKNKF